MAVTHRLRSRLLAVLITCVMMLSTLGGLAYVVSGAIRSMVFSADQMDDARALSAARGALAALKKQLSATIRAQFSQVTLSTHLFSISFTSNG